MFAFLQYRPLHKLLRNAVFFLLSAIFCFSTFSPLPRTAPTVRNEDTGSFFLPDYGHTLVAAHRMGKSVGPDNTMLALKTCLESSNPPDVIESDVQITKDGELVLYHDLFLEKRSDSDTVFGRERVPVFSKTYAELRELNMGAKYPVGDTFPYADLHGSSVPDDLRIPKVADMFDYVESVAPGQYRYILEVKFPFPWAPKIVDKLYKILDSRSLTDRVIVASFWPDVSHYIDLRYDGKMMRSANPFEVLDFYGCFKRNVDLSKEKFPFMALQMPYYWKDDKLLLANLGQTAFIDYAHRYGISVQYYTLSRSEDIGELYIGGADLLMTDRPERVFSVFRNTPIDQEAHP